MMIPWLVFLLTSLPNVHGRRDMCAGPINDIKASNRFNVSDEFHCVFIPPDDDTVLKKLDPEKGRLSQAFALNIAAARQHCGKFDAGLLQVRTGEVYKAFMGIAYELLGIVHNDTHKHIQFGPYVPLGMDVVSTGEDDVGRPLYNVKWDNGDDATLSDFRVLGIEELNWREEATPAGNPVIMSVGMNRLFLSVSGTRFKTFGYGGVVLVCHQEPMADEDTKPTARHTSPSGPQGTSPSTTSGSAVPPSLQAIYAPVLLCIVYELVNID